MPTKRWNFDAGHLRATVRLIADTTQAQRGEWNRLDAAAGDGDFGTTMSRGFVAARDALDAPGHVLAASISELLASVARTLTREMGGTSGPLWGTAFLRAGDVVAERASFGLVELAAMGRAAADGIAEHGGAIVGDRTMLDALEPAVAVLEATVASGRDDVMGSTHVLHAAAQAAAAGALATRGLVPRRGRAAYVGERALGSPDAGAVAVAVLLGAVIEGRPDPSVTATLRPVDSHGASTGSVEVGGEGTAQGGKHFVNHLETVVDESLAGFASAHADIVRWDPTSRIVARATPLAAAVGLVSGGGSGHEPLHVGFVGDGMLTVAVPGPIFASPSVEQIVAGICAAETGRGVLLVVKNYTGDVINFRLAAERALDEGIEVATVVVDDDVATTAAGAIGRRGTGATIFVEKIAGAAAAAGADLVSVAWIAQRVVQGSASFGIALGSCTPPGGAEIFNLPAHEVEIGVGIHGEPGRGREPYRQAVDLVRLMVDSLLATLGAGDDAPVLALVSGLGATPLIEQYLVFHELERQLAAAGRPIARSLVGPYITSLNMAGVTISLLILDAELTALWDAPVRTVALSRA